MTWLLSKALLEQCANSPSSPAQVAASLAASSLGGAACALSSKTPTPQACSWLGKTTAVSTLSRSGMTYKPLTDGLGEAVLTSFLAGFHARIFPSLAPARSTSSWRTPQRSLLVDLDAFSETWPRWGTMRNGGVLGACDAGAPHRRERIWIAAADADRVRVRHERRDRPGTAPRPRDDGAQGADSDAKRSRLEGATGQGMPGARREGVESAGARGEQRSVFGSAEWWHVEPDVGRVAYGVARGLDAAERVERLKCLGNGQVPATAALAWRELAKRGGWL